MAPLLLWPPPSNNKECRHVVSPVLQESARPPPALGHRRRPRDLGRVLRLELRLEHRPARWASWSPRCSSRLMYTTFIFSFTELTTAIPHAGGPFAYARRAFGPTGGYVAGFATLVEFVFAPPAIALAIGAYLNVQFPALDPKLVALGAYVVFIGAQLGRRAASRRPSSCSSRCSRSSSCWCSWAWSRRACRWPTSSRSGWAGGDAFSSAAIAGHLRRDPVRDLVLPGDRGRGHGGRGGARSAPHRSRSPTSPAS